MPELPEVEHARRRLARHWTGRRVVQASAPDAAAVRTHLSTRPSDAHPNGASWLERWSGQAIGPIRRHGKRIGWTVGELGVVGHFGMTGRWIRRDDHDEVPRGRLRVDLDDGQRWWFEDTRRFGCIAPVQADALDGVLAEGHGPDALDDAPDGALLVERLGTGRATVKARLLDQGRLAGVGNIQAVEALWRARIHPATPASQVDRAAWDRLAEGLRASLLYTLEDAGEDELVYLSSDRSSSPFTIYGRDGEPCPRCGASLELLRLGGRATVVCPACQVDPRAPRD